MVTRRLAGYAVAMEVARRAEGPEVNGDLRKTVSRRSFVLSRELKRKGYCEPRRHAKSFLCSKRHQIKICFRFPNKREYPTGDEVNALHW